MFKQIAQAWRRFRANPAQTREPVWHELPHKVSRTGGLETLGPVTERYVRVSYKLENTGGLVPGSIKLEATNDEL